MNPSFFRISLALLCLAMMIACQQSRLEIGPQGQLDELTLATPEGVQATLTGAYALLDGWDGSLDQLNPPWAAAGSNWILGSVTTDDAYKGAQPGEMPEIRELELYQWRADHPYLDIRFRALYEGIARANATLRLLKTTEGIPGGDREAIEGQALFLRAHYHFEAWKLWKNVPYYTETDEDFRKANNVDPLPLIIDDLRLAIARLPESLPEAGRAHRWTARAYLGKVLLYGHRYSEARTELDQVVNVGPYALEDCFHTIFTATGENGSEMILSIQASVNDGTPGGENGNFPDMLTFPGGASPFECCGFHQPSQNLVNAFRVDAQGLPLPDTYNDQNLGKNDFADPRLDWTVGRPGVPYLNWGLHDSTWIANPAASGPFSPKKFVHRLGEQSQVGWAGAQLGPVNIPILRYADVLLMLAECEAELGNLSLARDLVNQVRSRAANCAQAPNGGSSPIDDAGITWANYRAGVYDAPWIDPQVARKAIRMERRLEFALEGHRLFDLQRWDIAGGVLNDYLATEQERRAYLVAAVGYQARHDRYPLPAAQIELSKVAGVPQLVQNTGWE